MSMTKIKNVTRLELHPTPVSKVLEPRLAGFFAKAYKYDDRIGEDKIGFLISGIRLVSAELQEQIRVRLRLTWFTQENDGSFEIEEHVSSISQRRNSAITVFSVKYDAEKGIYDDVTVIRGRPEIENETFEGRLVTVTWKDGYVLIKPVETARGIGLLSCGIKRKQKNLIISPEGIEIPS